MGWQKKILWGLSLSLMVFACKSKQYIIDNSIQTPKSVYRVNSNPQAFGDAEEGWHYLTHGDYVGNGIPYEVFGKFLKRMKDSSLSRLGDNEGVPYGYNAFTNYRGEKVISGNCFSCHATKLNGQMVFGLGNTTFDYTRNTSLQISILNMMIKNKFGKDSERWQAYQEQAVWFESVAPAIIMNNPGINPAFRLEEALIKLRNPEDLSFNDSARFEIDDYPIGTDVPPLWNLKKKNALYYNGMGRGDYRKLIMQACLLGIHDSTQARQIFNRFDDVLGWMKELEPPKYPGELNEELLVQGKTIFKDHCSKCHGTYGNRPYYPNKIVPIKEVKTDSLYALYALNSPVNDWYNESWFHRSPPYAEAIPSFGYMAPPLDGVWATAPYLHNASVPDLLSLLDSQQRPTFWKRSMETDDYNLERVGWNYQEKENGDGRKTFNTTLPGYSNEGHYFGDELSSDQRLALIEYLKSL